MRLRPFVAAVVVASLSLCASSSGDASACGGSFRLTPEVSAGAVTDHRIVFKVSKTETILWDQMRYSGAPSELAWVLPVRDGARLELSHDEWTAALDAATQSTTEIGASSCPDDEGCARADSSPGAFGDTSRGANDNIAVVRQEVVGPYEVVTLRAKNGEGISAWLTTNGFAIPDASKTIVDQYTAEGFDFIALRLRPGEGTQAMRPVRVVMPGADPTLPMRMIAAGAGPKVGVLLWIVAEGRYRAQNAPNAVIDDAKLFVTGGGGNNLTKLQAAAVSDGRTWLTEYARPVPLTLERAYEETCSKLPLTSGPCADAGADASAIPCVEERGGCTDFDDLEVAARGLDPANVWITRMRADLPLESLKADLRLEAAEQAEVRADHIVRPTTRCEDTKGCQAERRAPIGTWAIAGLTALAAAAVARRRRT